MRQIDPAGPLVLSGEESDGELLVATTRDELAIIASSIGEAIQEIEEWEFGIRLGVSPAQARALRDKINEIVRTNWRPE